MSSAVAPEKYSELEIANCPLDMLIFNALFKGQKLCAEIFFGKQEAWSFQQPFP
jgi:hypothetical protein